MLVPRKIPSVRPSIAVALAIAATACSDAAGLDAGASPPECGDPSSSTRARACMVFSAESLHFEDDPALDGRGTLLVRVFDEPHPRGAPLAEQTFPTEADEGDVTALPRLDFDDLPATVYVLAIFADNPAWAKNPLALTYGTFAGGLDLDAGLRAEPAIEAVPLNTGRGNVVPIALHAMRRFDAIVSAALPRGVVPAGDGEGPLTVDAFDAASSSSARLRGAGIGSCTGARALRVPITGFFYGSGPKRFVAQIDDFDLGTPSPAGALVSAGSPVDTGGARAVDVPDDAYSIVVPEVELTTVLPGLPPKRDFHCPLP